jgi:predicted nucleotidyltransferase
MLLDFDKNIREFLKACENHNVRMLLVGGGAVNFHGYQRHSADLDFWIDMEKENLDNLKSALISIGFEEFEFPKAVENAIQNISIKISPITDIELITRFNPGKLFADAYEDAVDSFISEINYKVISFDDLIESKVRSGREKDQLDIKVLKRIQSDNS